MKSVNLPAIVLSDNEACALSMLVGGMRRSEFENALQYWIDQHTCMISPPDQSAGNNIVAVCQSYYITSPRVDESTEAALFEAMEAAVSKLQERLIKPYRSKDDAAQSEPLNEKPARATPLVAGDRFPAVVGDAVALHLDRAILIARHRGVWQAVQVS